MKSIKIFVFTICVLCVCNSAMADLKNATVAFASGNWKVLRDKNPMTDEIDCTGIYRNDYGIQLSSKSLYITISGGLKSIVLRFGDEKALPLRLATDIEEKVRVVILEGADFEHLRKSNYLRYQVGTIVDGLQTGEINLAGLTEALESINSGCPIQNSTQRRENTATEAQGNASCTATIIGRMKQQGLKSSQISAICK